MVFRKEKFSENISLLTDVLSAAKPMFFYILNHVVLGKIYLCVKVSGEDACETAVKYGKLNALCASCYALVKNIFTVKMCSINIAPDFTSEKSEVDFDVKASLRPLYLLGGAAVFLKNYIKIQLQKTDLAENNNKTINNRKTVDNNESE